MLQRRGPDPNTAPQDSELLLAPGKSTDTSVLSLLCPKGREGKGTDPHRKREKEKKGKTKPLHPGTRLPLPATCVCLHLCVLGETPEQSGSNNPSARTEK